MEIDEYKRILKERLTNNRYLHSLCVSKEAVLLAKKYGADQEKAQIAGLLHDIMKDTPNEEQIKFLENFNVKLNSIEKYTPKLWHAISGEQYVKNILGIKDGEILDAIRSHATARVNMSLLEKIIFIADFTSEDRDYPGVEDIRLKSRENLDKAMLEGLAFTISDLSMRKLPIHEDTFGAYNEIILKMRGDLRDDSFRIS